MSINAMSGTHRISGLANREPQKLTPTEQYQQDVLANPNKPMAEFDAWLTRTTGLTSETVPASVKDVREKMESYIASMGYGDYVSARNRPDVVNEAIKNGVKVVTALEGAQMQSILFDAITRALHASDHESLLCINVIRYYMNAYYKSLFSMGSRYAFFDAMRKSTDEKRMFANILHLLITTCNPALKQRNLHRIDLPRIINSLQTQKEKDNLTRAFAVVNNF